MKNLFSKIVSIFSAIMLVAQTFIFSAFLFVPIAQANEMCAVDADVVLLIDTSGSMADGEAPSNCVWWQLEWVGPSKQCVEYQQTGLTEGACLAKPDPPQCWPPEYTPATNSKLTDAKNAANSFLDNLESQDQSALVSFNSTAVLDKSLSNNHNQTRNAVNSLTAGGSTNIGDAISEAILDLNGVNGNPQASKTIILLTDGKANKPFGDGLNENQADIDYAEQKAQEASNLNYKIFTIGLGSDSDINETMLQNIANITGATYHHAPNGNDLADIYEEISQEMCEYGSISGCKYNDLDGDGQIEQGEEGLSDWEIVLSGGASATQLTDEDGCYVFAGLQDNEYTVSETGQEGWIQTYPQGGAHNVIIAQHNNVEDIDFANTQVPQGPEINPGDIVINEIMQNPLHVSDTYGEWFELYNTTQADIDLLSCTIGDNSGDAHTISSSLIVPVNGYVVLAKNGNPAQNGGFTPNYVYNGFNLSNLSDKIILVCGGTEIDRVEYDGGPNFPDPNGASMILLDPSLDNNIGANWCISTTFFGAGDKGTPGTQNDSCGEPPQPVCGDGIKNGQEECDGTDGVPAHHTCTTQCSLEYIPYCGDQTCNGQETCDTCQSDCGYCSCNPDEELVINGGFEIPEVTNQVLWDIFTSNLTNWATEWMSGVPPTYGDFARPESAFLELQRNGVAGDPHGGSQLAELDSGWLGPNDPLRQALVNEPASVKIHQDINTIPGRIYLITYYFSARPGTTVENNRLEFAWNGTPVSTVEAGGDSNTFWTEYQHNLTATDYATTIQFSDVGYPDSLGTYLDDVSVRCQLNVCGDTFCDTEENCESCSQDCECPDQEPLTISGENSSDVKETSLAIVWTTNHPATSRVVYDTVSHATLGDAPNYGYANSTTEDTNLVTNHSVVISGLTAGTTYYFRAVSHGSPEVVSTEVSATTTSSIVMASTTGGGGGGGIPGPTIYPPGHGEVAGASTENQGEVLGEATEQLPNTGVNPFPIMVIVLLIGFSAALGIKKLSISS